MAEQRTFNPLVQGSTPWRPTQTHIPTQPNPNPALPGTASQLLAVWFDLQNTAARLGHGGGEATTLKHYADPVSEVDRRAAAFLAELIAG